MALAKTTTPHPLVQQIQRAVGPSSRAAAFVPILYGSKELSALAQVPAARLAEHTSAAVEFIADKPPGRHKMRVRAVSGVGDARPGSMIEILNDDRPFLVDSVLGELQARGIAVEMLLHPIFKASRDKTGRLADVVPVGGRAAGGQQESYIAIKVGPLSEPQIAELTKALSDVLDEVRMVVEDWQPMLQRLRTATQDLNAAPSTVPAELLKEALAFLAWLADGNFTFLGLRAYGLRGDPETGDLVPTGEAGLGVLRDASVRVLRRGTELVAMTPEVRRFFFAPAPLIITKASVISRVHRRAHMDYIGIKTYRPDGSPSGEVRIVGLFTSQAYVRSPSLIPLLRHKVDSVVAASGHPRDSHDGKALLSILDSFPRDELFQIGATQLQEWTEGILDLETRPRVRVFARVDRFDRFVSVLVYVPRDRYNSSVRENIGRLLAETYAGRIATFYPYFPAEGPLVRVQFIIGRYEGVTPSVDIFELERRIADIVRTWEDRLADALAREGGQAEALLEKYRGAFSAGYRETFPPERALEDIRRIERLGPEQPVAIDFYREASAPASRLHAAVYRFGAPISLSERVPVLENLGFLAVDERSYRIMPKFAGGAREVALHDMVLETADGAAVDLARHDKRLEGCFLAVFRGDADNDNFNRLIVAAGADWRDVVVMRAYAAYLRQVGSPFGPRYLADTLHRHAGVARDLLELFHVRFNPGRRLTAQARTDAEAPIRERIDGALANVPSLDEDRILRQFLNLVSVTLRTSFFQPDADARLSSTLAFKLDSQSVETAPQPRPFREIWVYAPRVEGIHLRFAPIARGGLRWSDRAQDFRTEILGLVRAQLVKNAVIVPSGAKGGFLPKQLPRTGGREEIQKEGIAAYRMFISALLAVTDNIKDGKVEPPRDVVRHDGDDPYLVVAADKGTATFSDIANEISTAHGFWLDDAFASGGSAGYDHKKMAITARGAWECVKRHFREMDKDIQSEPFRVVGVGDMSGDVFGNGMLLSEHIQLVAAFDHRDIFIDPNPSTASFAERKRLFDLPRSSWQDYDKAKISKGGGVYPRSAKSIALSEEARSLLGIQAGSVTPNDLMRAVLKCRADLLWFGGIGTYVRAGSETDADAGDRANDPIRITASDVGAKVIGEGANLGVTQRARIEFAARGGRINTDFIDNSAGVNTSDQEVNIKIALGAATRGGRLTLSARNALLATMTDDVGEASLRNNYQQSLALSLAERASARELADYALLMRSLEARRLFERGLEALPSDTDLRELARSGRGLARPELAVLLSYAKIALQHDILASVVPDEPQLEPWLLAYFPTRMRDGYAGDIAAHSLRREIIALGLTNAIVNRGGPAMAVRLAEETNRTTADVAHAFLATRAVFDLPALWSRIDALDNKVQGAAQLDLYQATQTLVNAQTFWFLRDGRVLEDLSGTIARHREGMATLRSALADVLPVGGKPQLERRAAQLAQGGVPADLASEVAYLDVLAAAPAITSIADETGAAHVRAARAYLAIGEHLRIGDLTSKAAAMATPDHYDRLAVAQATTGLRNAQAALARSVIEANATDDPEAWLRQQDGRFDKVRGVLEGIAAETTLTISKLLVAAGQLGDLAAARPADREPSARKGQTAGHSRSGASESEPARMSAHPARS